ncbi:MAG: hypothetical protein AAFY91_02065 [Bacteroidota bacterium]
MALNPKPVYLFPMVISLTDTTFIPIARRSTQDDPEDLHFTPPQLITYLKQRGFVVLSALGPFTDDLTAEAGGVPIGGAYELSAGNSYNLPEGLVKIRRV